MMQLSWSSLRGPVFFIIIIIVLTQLHLIISASISAARAPAGDVTSSWYRGSDVTETTRRTVVSNAEVAESVRSNATASATKVRSRRHLHASQGCGPVCNLCRQILRSLRYKALCSTECEAGLGGTRRGRHYDFCLMVLDNPPPGVAASYRGRRTSASNDTYTPND